MTDKELVDRFLVERSPRNFSDLYDKCTMSLLRTGMYLTRNDRMQAEDLVQDVWVLAISKLETFRGESTLRTWLTGILIYKYRQGLRTDRPSKEARDLSGTLPEAKAEPMAELAMDLKRTLLELPDGYKQILVLHDMEGFKHREIASMLTIDEGTSKSQLFHARKAMREMLQDYKH